MSLAQIKHDLAIQAGFKPENKEQNKCISCSQEFVQDVNVHTDLGWKETRISGLCENCFDDIMS